MAQIVKFYLNDKGSISLKCDNPVDNIFINQLAPKAERILREADKLIIMRGDESISLSTMLTFIIEAE